MRLTDALNDVARDKGLHASRQEDQAGQPRSALDVKQIEALVRSAAEHLEGDERRRYRKRCLELTLMLRSSGLAAILAWHQCRARERHPTDPGAETTAEHWLAGQLAWTLRPMLVMSGRLPKDDPWQDTSALLDATIGALREAGVDDYVTLSRRALELADWFKLFAGSLIADERNTNGETP